MINLSNVTLLIVEPAKPDDAVKVLDICCQNIKFGASKVFTSTKPTRACNHELFKIPSFNYEQYNQFIVRNLSSVVDTDFCLIVQTDGLKFEDFCEWFKVKSKKPMAIIHFTNFRYCN